MNSAKPKGTSFMPIHLTPDGHQLTYTSAGHPDAPPLLMLHGWMSYGCNSEIVSTFVQKGLTKGKLPCKVGV